METEQRPRHLPLKPYCPQVHNHDKEISHVQSYKYYYQKIRFTQF